MYRFNIKKLVGAALATMQQDGLLEVDAAAIRVRPKVISQYLGHASLETTVIYTHLTPLNEARTRAALGVLHRAVA